MRESDPADEFRNVLGIAGAFLARDPKRQGDIFENTQVIEHPEFLKHDPNPAAQIRQILSLQSGGIVAEMLNHTARGFMRHINEAQKRGLPGSGRTREEGETAAFQLERNVFQDFRATPITHADSIEADNHFGFTLLKGVHGNFCQSKSRSHGCH
ncbi:MAG: hypothetical protein DHS20C06_05920 [Hyphobacterium sp.]|nr:MAG: hypothetical protein DHS20C06_05920 [Hyphobacterium sp.]